ncbi:hypothetical protein FS749_002315 [Ceratobasidium sp. UAMH 11750]|nr:hypothetical protein FS749_002315 [Ceratobasidium sp. UAMH 11750]
MDEENSMEDVLASIKPILDWIPYENKTVIFWVMKQIEQKDVLTIYAFRKMQERLRTNISIQSHHYRSIHGNVFDMVDVPQLIGRDISNPLVTPHVIQYPEVSSTVSEAWQSAKWLEHVPLDQLTPMYAVHGKHFYVNELS